MNLNPKFGSPWRTTCRLRLIPALAALLAAAAIPARAQQVKLYMKDGSYTLVKKYEVQGDKIRFYSLDTTEWEEMPVSLVDFDATRKAQQEDAAGHTKQLEQAKEFDKQRFDPAAAAPPTGFAVAPGRYLPPTEGVYAYDGARVIPLIQAQGEVVTDKQRALLTMAIPAPLLKKRALVQIDGTQAAVRIVSAEPVFFVQANDGWATKAELIPVKSTRSSRVLEKLQSGIGVGASGELHDVIPLERTEVSKGVVRLRPAHQLEPGEYALGEMIEGKLNLDVWDFGIDRPGKKVAPTADTRERQTVMGEQRPGQAPPTTNPSDVILHGCQPGQPCRAGSGSGPSPGSVPPSPDPSARPGSGGNGDGTGNGNGPPNN